MPNNTNTRKVHPLAEAGRRVVFTDTGNHGSIIDRQVALETMPVLFPTGGWIPVQFDDDLACWVRHETLEVL